MTTDRIVGKVVNFLGCAVLLLVTALFLLLHQIVNQANGSGTIDAATLGAVTGIGTLAGTALGALGAVLVSTRSGQQDVQVVNDADTPVPVDDAPKD